MGTVAYTSDELKRIQEKECYILESIVNICERNCIEYFLIGGTCLGAVRHDGFIPWDDDFDVVMLRDDYEKFCDYCIHHQDEMKPYKLLTRKNEENYPYNIARLNNMDYRAVYENVQGYDSGVFIDIYPLDGAGSKAEQVIQRVKKKKSDLFRITLWSISRGRTVRQTILGGYVFGVGSTLTSFIVLGNYSMGMQVTGKADFIAQYLESGDLYGMIVSIIKTMPGAPVIMVVVLLTMIAFYATSFDSIALTASCYSYHTLEDGEQPNKGIQLMWCILLILLPIALLFAESSMNNLQSVSIVAAFPIGAVIVMIAVSFMKDAKKYMEELGNKK